MTEDGQIEIVKAEPIEFTELKAVGGDNPKLDYIKAIIAAGCLAVLVAGTYLKIDLDTFMKGVLATPIIWLYGRGVMTAAIDTIKGK